ncbi:MAG: glycosyltransferase family 4 protein [Colwellia sp.]|nr:glycosyltransferase family 4 protein [Colwellia sp.]
MKICHCFSSSQSAYYFLDGQIQYMQKHGHTIAFAVPDDGFIDQLKTMFPNVKIHIIPIVRPINLISDFKALFYFIKLFRKERFDIIHLHTPKASLLGAIAGRILGHPNIIFHLHGLVSLKFNIPIKGLTLLMERVPLLLSHKVICVSKSLAQLCVDNRFISAKKIMILANGSINGIDYANKFNRKRIIDETTKLQKELKIEDKFVIGYLGRINNDKGIYDIIDVINTLSKSIPNLIMVFVGPNELPVDIDRFFQDKLNTSYIYIPRTPQPELYISVFDVMLFPSYREGFGLVTAEANALKVPVVAYNIAGIRDSIVNNKTGFLVEPDNKKALVQSIKHYHDYPEIRKMHGENGRIQIKSKFTPQIIWQAQLQFYEDLLNV